MTNLRIESKKYTAPPVVQDLSNPIFKPVTTYRDPLHLKDLDIWIDNKKVNTYLIEYLDIVILPGRKEVTANIKFTNLDYFIDGDFPDDWEAKLKEYKYTEKERNVPRTIEQKLRDNKSTLTIINGIPIHEESINDISRGFDIDGYYSGLIFPPSKIVVKLKPHFPLLVECTYAPREFSLNLNSSITFFDKNNKIDYLSSDGYDISLYSLEGEELVRFFHYVIKDNEIKLEKGIYLTENLSKINNKDTYIIKTIKDGELIGVKLEAVSQYQLPDKKSIIDYVSGTYTKIIK